MNLCGFNVGSTQPIFLIAGNCVVESEQTSFETADALVQMCKRVGISLIYKSSFDKANRSSIIPVITDVHEDTPIDEVASVVDALQTPAFLCRQTNFITRVCESGLPVNIKKGQFMAPEDMQNVVDKARSTGNQNILLCERGVSFGYRTLISDMRGLATMRTTGCPVVFDATHSVQQPGGLGSSSGGQRQFVPVLARAAVASGVAGLFMETHPDPDNALSDGPNAWPLSELDSLVGTLLELDAVTKASVLPENQFLQLPA